MNINIETKYNINDEVYVIHNTNKYNDYYATETEWQLVFDNNYGRIIKPLKINKIVVKKYQNETEILYDLKEYQYLCTDEDMFLNLEDAKEECKIRNMKY